MFMGEYSHTIDAKGRIIVPAKFRESLGDNIVVTKGLDNCLFVYTSEDWRKFEEKLRTLPLTNKDARKFTRFFLAGAAEMEIDKQGRILIPSVLREFAALEKDVVLVGVGSRIEIWDKARWNESISIYDDDTTIIYRGYLNDCDGVFNGTVIFTKMDELGYVSLSDNDVDLILKHLCKLPNGLFEMRYSIDNTYQSFDC